MKILKSLFKVVSAIAVNCLAAFAMPFTLARREMRNNRTGVGCVLSGLRVFAWVGLVLVNFVFAGTPSFLLAIIKLAVMADTFVFVVSLFFVGLLLSFNEFWQRASLRNSQAV